MKITGDFKTFFGPSGKGVVFGFIALWQQLGSFPLVVPWQGDIMTLSIIGGNNRFDIPLGRS
jgi:hypothetical protein